MVCACQQQPGEDKATLDDLRVRVRVLEQGQQQIVDEMRANAKKVAAAAIVPIPPPPSFKLMPTGNTYSSKARCEAARDIAQTARTESYGGAMVMGGAPIYCLPL